MTVYCTEQQTRLHDLIQRVNERKGSLMLQVELAQRVTKLALSCQKWESSRDKFALCCFVMGCFFQRHAAIRKEEELTKKN